MCRGTCSVPFHWTRFIWKPCCFTTMPAYGHIYRTCPFTATLPPPSQHHDQWKKVMNACPYSRQVWTYMRFDFSLISRLYLTFCKHKLTQTSYKFIHILDPKYLVERQGMYGITNWIISQSAMARNCRNSDMLKSKMLLWTLSQDDQGGGSSSPGRVKNFHFSISPRPALGSTQPPIKWVPGALSR
jgi:hypothetical protein